MAHLRLSFLDTFQVWLGQQPITQFRSNNGRGLLLFLALQAERPFSRDVLATLFWPGDVEKVANNNLRQILYRLRKALGDLETKAEPYLLVTRQTVQFNPHSDFSLDVHQFLQTLEQGDLETAVAHYPGDLLPGFTCNSLQFEDWLRQERERLHQLAMETMAEVSQRYVQNGRFEQAQVVLRKQLALEPWHEVAHRQLMRVLALMGNRGAALAQYELCREQLWEELGVEPVAKTETLFEEIKVGRYGRLAEAAPALANHNLPTQTTPLIGRKLELQQLSELLKDRKQRLVTIVGSGGMGKTRLALALAGQPRLYGNPQHGVYFVPLAPLNDPAQIVPALADALNFSLSSDEQQRSHKQQLFDFLHQKEMLLVFDNFEHLLTGANLISELLQSAPKMQIVTTSRERLQLQEEQVYPLQGLSFPETALGEVSLQSEEMQRYTAVQLFMQTAQRVQPHFKIQNEEFSSLIRICHLLNGMPLAVELAAGWADMLPLAEIVDEIKQSIDFLETDVRNMPERHRSMRAVFDASWQRLNADERSIFAQLTVFQGGFTRQAGQAVTGASLRLLGRLVNKSLLHYDHTRQRYQVHELLRQYGAERLAVGGDGKTAVYHQHSSYYLTLLHQQTANLKSQHQQTALAEIEVELGNIRTAWHWAIVHSAFDHLSQAMDALRLFYAWKGLYQASEEAAKEIIAALPNPTTHTEQRLAAKAFTWQAAVCRAKGANELGQTLLERGNSLLHTLAAENIDVRPEQIETLLLAGQWVSDTDYKQAQTMYQQAYEISEAWGNTWYQAQSLRYWGMIEYSLGQYVTAENRLQQALTLAQQTGDGRLQARILDELSQLAAQLAQFEKAEQYVRQSYTIYDSFSDPLSLALGTGKLGIILVFAGKFTESESLLNQSFDFFQDSGNENMLAQSYIRLGVAQTYVGKLPEAHTSMTEGLQLYRHLSNNGMAGWALWGLGEVLLALAEYEKAQQAFAESVVLLEQARYLDKASWSLGLQGLATSFLDKGDEARYLLQQGLKAGSEVREYLSMLTSVAGTALLYSQNDKLERAAELYGLMNRYPFFAIPNQGWPARFNEQIRPLLSQLPVEKVQAAQARGQQLDLWQTAVSLHNELTDLG